jgi:ubiquitin-protein ligase
MALRRIKLELSKLERDPAPHFVVGPKGEDLFLLASYHDG